VSGYRSESCHCCNAGQACRTAAVANYKPRACACWSCRVNVTAAVCKHVQKREQQLSHWERCIILTDRARLGSTKCGSSEAASPIRSRRRDAPPTSSNVSSSTASRIASAKDALITGRAKKLLLAVAIAADAEACSPR